MYRDLEAPSQISKLTVWPVPCDRSCATHATVARQCIPEDAAGDFSSTSGSSMA
jgi:hypothetical protein